MTYSELLQDPRWQAKRLTILSRDNYTCRQCSATNTELHVHHHVYLTGHLPWEYEDEYLITLCAKCHQNEETLKSLDSIIVEHLLCQGITRQQMLDIITAITRRLQNHPLASVLSSLTEAPEKPTDQP